MARVLESAGAGAAAHARPDEQHRTEAGEHRHGGEHAGDLAACLGEVTGVLGVLDAHRAADEHIARLACGGRLHGLVLLPHGRGGHVQEVLVVLRTGLEGHARHVVVAVRGIHGHGECDVLAVCAEEIAFRGKRSADSYAL